MTKTGKRRKKDKRLNKITVSGYSIHWSSEWSIRSKLAKHYKRLQSLLFNQKEEGY